METGVRQEADHASARRGLQLAPSALQLLLQFSRRRMRFAERILHALAGRDVVVHFVLVSQVEGDRAVDLLETQRRERPLNCLRRLAGAKLSYDDGKRHATFHQVEAIVASLDE